VADHQSSGRGSRDVMRGSVLAFLLVCALTHGAAVAAQTAGTPHAPLPPTPSSGGALRLPAGPLDPDGDTPQRGSASVIAVPSAASTGLRKGWSFRFEAPACAACPDRAGIGALWDTSGTVAWQVGADKYAVGLTGQRGARLPLFMTAPDSGNFVPMASDVVASDTRTRWVLRLSAEHTVLVSPDRTMSLFGDLFLSLGSIGRVPKTRDVRTPAQTALIGGVRVRLK
jgi:hypothetical protein